MRALPRKIVEILPFLPPNNCREIFHKICIAKVLLTPKPRGVAKFRECQLPYRAEILRREKKQVAQLWRRDHTKLDTSSINVQRYSQNHAQNWIFGPPYGGIRGNISALSEIYNTKKPCSRVSSREGQFYS